MHLSFLKALAVLFLSLLPAVAAHAAAPCPDTRLGQDWSPKCFETLGSRRQVKQAYRSKLHFDRRGFVTVRIEDPLELVAVNRQGTVVVPGIYFWGDFDYPNAYGGISRFSVPSGAQARKCGYFEDTTFAVIVPPLYDNCSSFQDGEATVCNGCTKVCTDEDCHDSRFLGGDSLLTLDAKGRTIRKTGPQTIESICQDSPRPTVSHQDGHTIVDCDTPKDSPFQTPQ